MSELPPTPSATSVPSATGLRLWYCAKCTRLIQPPGSEGSLAANGDHLCKTCAPVETVALIQPARSHRPSSGAIKLPEKTDKKNSERQIQPASPSPAIHASKPAVRKADPEQGKAPILLIACGVGMFVLAIVGVVMTSASNSTQTVAQGAPRTPAVPELVPTQIGKTPSPAGSQIEESKIPARVDPVIEKNPVPDPIAPLPIQNTNPVALPPAVPIVPTIAGLAGQNTDEVKKEFSTALTKIAELAQTEKFTAAIKELADLKTRYGRTEAWPILEAGWTKTECSINGALKVRADEAQAAADKIEKADKPASIDEIELAWKARSEIQDELAAGPAREVLKAAAKARGRFASQAREKKCALVNDSLDTVEKLIKSKPNSNGIAAILKTLDEITERCLADADLNSSYVERAAALHYDASVLRDGELASYKADIKAKGRGVEIEYEFAKVEQFKAWTYSDPANIGGAAYDEKNGNVVLKISGKHDWDGKDRRNCPILTIPFNFQPGDWSFEAVTTSSSDKANKPDYGILIWDGGQQCVRLSLREHNAKDLQIVVGGSSAKQDNFWNMSANVPGKTKEQTKLAMYCNQGVLTFAAMTAAKTVASPAKVQLNFEPKFAGLFIRSTDDGENTQATFDNVRISALVSKERIKEAADIGRSAAVSLAREVAFHKGAAVKITDDEPPGNTWASAWVFSGKGSDNTPRQCDWSGRTKVWKMHPISPETPLVVSRKIRFDAGKAYFLRFDVSAVDNRDFILTVKGNGKDLFSHAIKGSAWVPIEINLSEFGGQDLELSILNGAGGEQAWDNEYGHFDNVRIGQK